MIRAFYILLILSLIVSCTERMDIDVDSTYTRLTVEGKVTSDFKKHYVRLSESSDLFFNQSAIPVTGAIISVSDGTNNYTYTETKPGYYESNIEFAGKTETKYSLSILNVDIDKDGKDEEYFASSSMPKAHIVDSIKVYFDPEYEDDEGDEGEYWVVSLFLKDNKNTKDYYGFASKVNNILVDDTITEVVVVEDTYFNGSNSNGVEIGEFYQEKPDEIIKLNDEITLETYSITEDYYEFVSELQEMDNTQIPMFSGPPANIRTNISNGAIGYFAVYSITRTKTKVNSK